MAPSSAARWAAHASAWRDPAQIVAQWADASAVDPALLQHRVVGPWWDILDDLDVTLLVSREYEHLLIALSMLAGRPRRTFMPLPHPSGIAFDPRSGQVHIASTRNPNQVLGLEPIVGDAAREDDRRVLAPVRSRYHPGALYLHDLAVVGGRLYGNAVGQNAVVRLDGPDGAERAWWPRAIERDGNPDFERNYLQLNSIAAGRDIRSSFFSASTDRPSSRRPGHRNFPVDGRGVIFSGRSREPVVRGLTRPHSTRLAHDKLWVLNSGYGEIGYAESGRFEPVAQLPGWTRGLAFHGNYALVATSRVIPRFRQYAPGLDLDKSTCGVHALDVRTGTIAASLLWANGNQVFAVEAIPRRFSGGLPFVTTRSGGARARDLFYRFTTKGDE